MRKLLIVALAAASLAAVLYLGVSKPSATLPPPNQWSVHWRLIPGVGAMFSRAFEISHQRPKTMLDLVYVTLSDGQVLSEDVLYSIPSERFDADLPCRKIHERPQVKPRAMTLTFSFTT
jgi:hypothetical protein